MKEIYKEIIRLKLEKKVIELVKCIVFQDFYGFEFCKSAKGVGILRQGIAGEGRFVMQDRQLSPFFGFSLLKSLSAKSCIKLRKTWKRDRF